MKKTIEIQKSLLTAPIDFAQMLATHKACDVELDYAEQDFIPVDGDMVVFDAYSSARRYNPFDVKFGAGAYPFYLSCKTDSGMRVAYCGMRFDEEPAVEFKLLTSEDALGKLPVDPYAAAVAINSGVCCIADGAAYKAFVSHIKDEIHPLAGHIVLDGQTHTNIELYGKHYAVFSTGWGDGRYRCYAGYGKSGKAVVLLVDFGMIEYPEDNGELVSVVFDDKGRDMYIHDPNKTERENNVAKWTQKLKAAQTAEEKLAAYSRRGYAYHSMGKTDAALNDYLAAIKECKNVKSRIDLLRAWAVYDNAAEIYSERSDYDSAIKIMNSALEVGDDFYSGAYGRLIDLYLLTKRTADAKKIAERMLAARPNDPVACVKHAEVSVSAMDYESAASMYELLVTKFKLYDNLFDEASCLIELGKLEDADAVLERYPAKESNEQYWYYKAYIDFRYRRLSDAREKAEQSRSLDGEYLPPLYLMIDMASIMQEYHSVALLAEEYKKLRPEHEYGYCICAEAQLILENYTESSKNYCYLYENINQSDKYAALAAITAAKTRDGKTAKTMLKKLKHKRSPYYYGALYAIYFSKYSAKGSALDKVLFKLGADDDFMLQLAVYFANNGIVVPATRLLDALSDKKNPPFEVTAQQIRLAEKINDRKHFEQFIEYYIHAFLGTAMPHKDKFLVANRFITDKSHSNWLYNLTALVKTRNGEQSPSLDFGYEVDSKSEDGTEGKESTEEK